MLTGEGSLGDYVITCYDVISTIKAHDRSELGRVASQPVLRLQWALAL